MPLMPAIAEPVTTSTAVEVRDGASVPSTISTGMNYVLVAADYLAEDPIEFVAGIEAPARERGVAEDEPAGSGPFGF
jgi:hypothetical protein